MAQSRDIEKYLAVGTVVMFHTSSAQKGGARYRTAIRGWHNPSHILLDRPKISKDRFVVLQENQACVVRYLAEGTACAFNCSVRSWDHRKYHACLRVTWPNEIECVAFRKFERVKVTLPCLLTVGEDEVAGELRDLSLGGCGFTCAREVEKDATVSLSVTLPGVAELQGIQAVVRASRTTGQGALVGCEFTPGQAHAEYDIASYVSAVLGSSGRGEGLRNGPILVVENDEKMSQRLKENLKRRGYGTVLTSNTIDAAHRLRTASPDAVLLSATLSDLPGVDLCRVIKTNKVFAELPVFVYGGEGADTEAKAKAAGATGYFPPSASLAPDVAGALGKALQGDNPRK